MNNSMQRILATAALAGAALAGPAIAILTDDPVTDPVTTASAQSNSSTHHHSGPDYPSITGWRVGAPSEAGVSQYGGSHKHLWVEQQLYGPGLVAVPHVDNSPHQSR